MSPDDGTRSLKERRIRFGGWLAMPELLVVEAAARAGFDWLGFDLQHGAWDLGTAFCAIQLLDALGTTALVRVSEQELELMPRLLDHGAAGVVVAMERNSPRTSAGASGFMSQVSSGLGPP